ncbi:hypothetical protein EDC01DRAFT_610224 [Geopyxis carbonaria]|nr:hypothetical protein EDC01DRAFT_610224 [Geopyxis carbonaria]
MLGRLFNSASSTGTSPSGTRPSTSHANEGDDTHTRNLLYPDTSSVASSFHSGYSFSHNSLSQSSASSSGLSENIDLEASRDVRVIIAQDGSASELKAVLYDSKPQPIHSNPVAVHDEGPTSPSLGGPYGRSRRKAPQNPYALGTPEDELRIFTDCMFGSAPLSYKGPSTKVHMLPNIEERRPSSTNGSPMMSRRGSLRGGGFTPQSQYQSQAPPPVTERRKSVLITRLFSVVMPPSPTSMTFEGSRTIPSRPGDQTPTPASSVGSNNGFPFPKTPSLTSSASSSAMKIVKPPKTAMYAVGLIISLPCGPSSQCSSIPTRCCYHKLPNSGFDLDYAHRHEYCCPTPPIFDDDFQSLPPGSFKADTGLDDFYLASAGNDGRMDLVTKHWDVISRALSDLQRVSQARILEGLNTAGITSPQATQNGYKYRKRIELKKLALMRDDVVRLEVERLRWRVVSGIKVPRVVVGQGRWDLWQEEAKWANSRFGGRDMNFFFLTLLTAFLGHHTDWLDVLGPESYKRRHVQKARSQVTPEDSSIPVRTILLSSDRIAARRLIYLLSAFLPSKPHATLDAMPPPSRTSSINYLSQSPPTFTTSGSMSSSKVGSLRKKAKKKPSKLNMVENENDQSDAVDMTGWDIPQSSVNASGASSVAGSVLQLPIASQAMRKSGSAGTLTTAPSAVTVAANAPMSPQKVFTRPGSRDSSASVNLMSTLKRTGTANTSADSNDSRWGSFLSFWSNEKSCSSAGTSEPDEHHPTGMRTRPVQKMPGLEYDDLPVDVGVLCMDDDQSPHIHHQPEPPFSPILSDTPIRCSVDEATGTVNVDVPFGPSFASLGSPLASPPTSSWAGIPSFDPSYMSTSSFAPAMQSSPSEDDSTGNVAGWIEDERFHPDFLLQAVKPYAGVEDDIKRAMRMEPTPPPTGVTPWSENGGAHNGTGDKWITVSEVLVADAMRLQIKRLRLRRRANKPATSVSTVTRLAPLPEKQPRRSNQPGGDRSTNPFFGAGGFEDDEEEEVLEEEVVCDVDDTLATAIETIIGIIPSRTPCNDGESGCKSAVLGALEKVIREVLNGNGQERWGNNVLTEGIGRWVCGVEEPAATAQA